MEFIKIIWIYSIITSYDPNQVIFEYNMSPILFKHEYKNSLNVWNGIKYLLHDMNDYYLYKSVL